MPNLVKNQTSPEETDETRVGQETHFVEFRWTHSGVSCDSSMTQVSDLVVEAQIEDENPVCPAGESESRHFLTLMDNWSGEKRDIPISTGEITLGKGNDNTIIIHDPEASEHHFRINLADGICTLTDLGSSCGTRINGVLKNDCTLQCGDRIQVGQIQLFYRVACGTHNGCGKFCVDQECHHGKAESKTSTFYAQVNQDSQISMAEANNGQIFLPAFVHEKHNRTEPSNTKPQTDPLAKKLTIAFVISLAAAIILPLLVVFGTKYYGESPQKKGPGFDEIVLKATRAVAFHDYEYARLLVKTAHAFFDSNENHRHKLLSLGAFVEVMRSYDKATKQADLGNFFGAMKLTNELNLSLLEAEERKQIKTIIHRSQKEWTLAAESQAHQARNNPPQARPVQDQNKNPLGDIGARWVVAIKKFKKGEKTQACTTVMDIINGGGADSPWTAKANSFYERRCVS